MNEKTDKLLQQAGKYLSLEKLGLALEIYLKVQEMEPEDTTIINNIGDLYVRRGDNVNALKWYCMLAEKFELREQIANAIAIYRKILKLTPTDQRIIEMLADLYVRVKQVQNAKSQYQTLVEIKMSGNDHAQSLRILQKISDLDPTCPKALLELAKFQERYGWEREALENYLKAATAAAQKNDLQTARQIVEDIFRLRPTHEEFLKSFFLLLRRIDLSEKGISYLESLSLIEEPEFRVMVSEAHLEQGNFDAAQSLVQGFVTKCPGLYEPAMRIFQERIARGNVEASLEMLNDIFETSVHLKDETALKVSLDSLLDLDPNNIRLLKMLTSILIRLNDKERLETYLQRLVILQLKSECFDEALESLNKIVMYGKASFYLDLFQLLKEASVTGRTETLRTTSLRVIHALENGKLDSDHSSQDAMAVGVGEEYIRLAMGLDHEAYADLLK